MKKKKINKLKIRKNEKKKTTHGTSTGRFLTTVS